MDGDGNVTLDTYDAAGQVLTSQTFAANGTLASSVANTYDAAVYDLAGNQVQSVDGNSDITVNAYDALGEVTSQTLGWGTLAAATTLTSYDQAGLVQSIQDPDHNLTSYTHDALGNVLSTTDSLGHSTRDSYDQAGNLTSVTDRDGRTRVITYYGNRPHTETWYAANGGVSDVRTYTYDKDGNLLTAHNNAGTYTMTYDGNQLKTQTDPNGVTLTFGYDGNANVTSLSDSLGGTVHSVYNATGNLASRSFTGPNGQQMREDFTYDQAGNLATATRYADLAGTQKVGFSQYTYDDNRLKEISHQSGSGSVLADYQYSYDAGGRLTSENDNGTVTNYNYDATNQLIQAGSAGYNYDANGNRQGGGYQVFGNNEMSSDGTWNYAYDNEGNITGKTNIATGETWAYSYDNANHMTAAVHKDSAGNVLLQAGYSYDAFGNQIAQSVTQSGSTTVTHFTYQDPQSDVPTLWAELNGSNSLQMRYLHGDQPNQLLGRADASGNAAWYLTDQLGSVRGVTNAAGALQQSVTYDAFGNTASTGFGRFGFDGYAFHAELGLYATKARFYDSATGRWYSQDPTGFDAGDSNLSRYVGNAPINGTDPSGNDLFAKGDEAASLIVQGLGDLGGKGKGIKARAIPLSGAAQDEPIYYIMPERGYTDFNSLNQRAVNWVKNPASNSDPRVVGAFDALYSWQTHSMATAEGKQLAVNPFDINNLSGQQGLEAFDLSFKYYGTKAAKSSFHDFFKEQPVGEMDLAAVVTEMQIKYPARALDLLAKADKADLEVQIGSFVWGGATSYDQGLLQLNSKTHFWPVRGDRTVEETADALYKWLSENEGELDKRAQSAIHNDWSWGKFRESYLQKYPEDAWAIGAVQPRLTAGFEDLIRQAKSEATKHVLFEVGTPVFLASVAIAWRLSRGVSSARGLVRAATSLSQPGALRRTAVEVHNLAQTGASRIPVKQSTVAIVEATLPNGTRQLFASGSGGYLNPAQVNRLAELGVPRENIFSGARYYRGFSAVENHAERVILLNLPTGAKVNRWGISWGGRQRPIPCDVCEPFVNQAGGVLEGT